MPKEPLYWRQDSFETLATLQKRFVEHPELADYVEYLSCLEQGLRRRALGHLEPLLEGLQQLDVARQRELASILCRETDVSLGHKLIPHPLQTGFLAPVIRDWMERDPDAAEPRRWTGDLDDLKRAVELDASCDHTRWRLILRILGHVGFSTHELPQGYLGDVETDEGLLTLAEREAQRLIDDEIRATCLDRIREEQEAIDTYKRAGGASMHFFNFVADPPEPPRQGSDPAGAYVNCWIDEPTKADAEQRARASIAEAGWSIVELEDYSAVDAADYDDDPDGRAFFDEAVEHGAVLVFHTWPASDDESE